MASDVAQCSVDGCTKVASRGRLCRMHCARVERHGDVNVTLRPSLGSSCSIEGCLGKPHGRGLCSLHLQRVRHHGSVNLPQRTPPDLSTCRKCGIDFLAQESGQRFCGHRCSGLAARKPPRSCASCGELFTGRGASLCCSKRCAWALRRTPPTIVRCDGCGKPTAPRPERLYNQRHFCSRACASVKSSFKCDRCGQDFLAVHRRSLCASCRWETVGRLRNRAYVQRHKARKRTTSVERIDPRRVFERDGWTCQLCHLPIVQSLRHPHLLSATVDHIVPLVKGGTHTWGNVQAAHFSCNSKKGARIPAGAVDYILPVSADQTSDERRVGARDAMDVTC